jgi:hypothetical protein
MILRINILTPALVADSICGTTLNSLVPDSIVIKVDDVIVTPSFADNTYTVNIPLTNVWDTAKVEITVTHSDSLSDFYTYHNIFEVYGYDLGNTMSIGATTGREPFQIVMIREDYRTALQQQVTIESPPGSGIFIANPDYVEQPIQYTRPAFIIYRKPFTKEIHYYKASSIIGDSMTYYDVETGDVLSTSANGVFCYEGEYQIKAYSLLQGTEDGCCCPTPVVIDECLSSTYTVPEMYKLMPELFTTISCNTCDNDCITNISTNYTESRIDLSQLTCLYVDDVLRNPLDDVVVKQIIYGIGSVVDDDGVISGIIIDSITKHLGNYTVGSVTTPGSVDFENCTAEVTDTDYGGGSLWRYIWDNFKTPDVGDYILKTEIYIPDSTLTDGKAVSCVKNYTFTACNYFDITQTKCNTYTLTNYSFDTVSVVISKMNSSGVFVAETNGTFTLGQCENTTLTISSDGIYKISYTRGSTTQYLIVINYCNIQDCVLSKLEDVICCNPTKICNVENVYDYNVLMSLIMVLFAQLNEEYNFNFVYELISDEKLTSLYKTSQIIDRINDVYCETCEDNTACDETISIDCTTCN